MIAIRHPRIGCGRGGRVRASGRPGRVVSPVLAIGAGLVVATLVGCAGGTGAADGTSDAAPGHGRVVPTIELPADGRWFPLGAPDALVGPHADGRGAVNAMIPVDDRLVVAGSLASAGGHEVRSMAAWDGESWAPFGGGADGPISSFCRHDGRLIAAGAFTEIGSVAANRVAAFDGTAWTPLGAGFAGPVQALVVHEGHLVAGGEFTATGDGREILRVARWTGSAWVDLGAGIGPGRDDPRPRSAPAEHVLALASVDGRLIAGGRFTHAGSVALDNVAAFDGAVWTPWGAFDDEVNALAVLDGSLVAGGKFQTADDGVRVNHVARWGSGRWYPMGTGFTRWVFALHVNGSTLVAGGCFREAGTVPCNGLARWDVSREPLAAWEPLGSGVDRCVTSFAVHDGALVAGGNFSSVGSDPIRLVTRFGEAP